MVKLSKFLILVLYGLNVNASDQEINQDLEYLADYYGNPDYTKAMTILNDESLKKEYAQALDQLQQSFLAYANRYVINFHSSSNPQAKVASGQTPSIASFIHSAKNNTPAQSSAKVQAPVQTVSSSSNNVNSFLNSLQG